MGDTGCRLDHTHTPQACSSSTEWPFEMIVSTITNGKGQCVNLCPIIKVHIWIYSAAFALYIYIYHTDKNGVIVHLGDYVYRDKPCPQHAQHLCGGSPYGDGFAAWEADFFKVSEFTYGCLRKLKTGVFLLKKIIYCDYYSYLLSYSPFFPIVLAGRRCAKVSSIYFHSRKSRGLQTSRWIKGLLPFPPLGPKYWKVYTVYRRVYRAIEKLDAFGYGHFYCDSGTSQRCHGGELWGNGISIAIINQTLSALCLPCNLLNIILLFIGEYVCFTFPSTVQRRNVALWHPCTSFDSSAHSRYAITHVILYKLLLCTCYLMDSWVQNNRHNRFPRP